MVTKEIETGDESEEDDIVDADAKNEILLEVGSETFKDFLFVEANPALPDLLYVMAENTIRLFRLNNRYYDYFNNLNIHCIKYNGGYNEYDDLRPEGRMQAHKRARKSLQQLKTMQKLKVDPETTQLFIGQYKILMELTGYASVWATVFNDGDNPGGFNDIMGVPAPVAPTFVPVTPPPASSKRTRDIVDVSNPEKAIDKVQDEFEREKKRPRYSKIAEYLQVSRKRLRDNVEAEAKNKDKWKFPVKTPESEQLPGMAISNKATAASIIKDAISCSEEYSKEFEEYMESLNYRLGEGNAYFNFSIPVK